MMSAPLLVATSILVIVLWWTAQLTASRRALGVHAKEHMIKVTLIAVIWPALLLGLGMSRFLAHFEMRPPPILFFGFAMIGFSIYLGFSKFGTLLAREISVAALLLFQSFRLLAEAVIYFGVHEGRAPVQLSIEGYSLDSITGILGLGLGLLALKRDLPRFVLQLFNVVGIALLLVIAFLAIATMPLPIRYFYTMPTNAWITMSPYILLPGVLVVAAWTGHFILIRKLRMQRR